MPSALERAAESYRRGQAATAAKTALAVGEFWEGVEVGNPASERNFVTLATGVLEAGFRDNVAASREFVAERVDVVPANVEMNFEQAARSLGFVGPVKARRKLETGTLEEPTLSAIKEARDGQMKSVRGSAMRLAALGGREVVRRSTNTRVGYMRVTRSDNPCYFCVMLASRGPSFTWDSFAASDARFQGDESSVKIHDSCSCAFVSLVKGEEEDFAQLKRYRQMWADLSGLDPKDSDASAVVTFRRNYDRKYGRYAA